jgi:hypothetical protein
MDVIPIVWNPSDFIDSGHLFLKADAAIVVFSFQSEQSSRKRGLSFYPSVII